MPLDDLHRYDNAAFRGMAEMTLAPAGSRSHLSVVPGCRLPPLVKTR